jgi:hypothetical protein
MEQVEQAKEVELCWSAFGAALRDRNHPFRTPVLLSVDAEGYPSGRVMTMRAIDRKEGWMRFHLDRRSPKFADWSRNSAISGVFYDKPGKWQIRVRGKAKLHFDDELAREAWESSHPMCQRTYLTEVGPGQMLDWEDYSTFPAQFEKRRPTAEESELGFSRFAVLYLAVRDIDSLHLEGTGHQRFRIETSPVAVQRLAP